MGRERELQCIGRELNRTFWLLGSWERVSGMKPGKVEDLRRRNQGLRSVEECVLNLCSTKKKKGHKEEEMKRWGRMDFGVYGRNAKKC